MSRMFPILMLSMLILASASCGQKPLETAKRGELKALAKFVSDEGGDKIHISKYAIIKDFTDTTFPGDTVNVGYYFYKPNAQHFDTVLLVLNRYTGQAAIKNYFVCPDFDATIGIQKAKVDLIDFKYWEGCETGKGDCKPLTFTRNQSQKNWFLLMPCGGTETAVTVSGLDNGYAQKLHLFSEGCPPYLELTSMVDGKYSANMMACGLGGQVSFNLATAGQTKNGK